MDENKLEKLVVSDSSDEDESKSTESRDRDLVFDMSPSHSSEILPIFGHQPLTSLSIQEESKLSSSALSHHQSLQEKQSDRKRESELHIFSETIDHNRLTPKNLDDLAMRAARLLREAGGLIGSPKPIRQFCGRVLIVLALAIATTVAAVAVMSMLGVATPAFLVPYLAAIQASSMVSTVLNFVAAKLTLDLNTAAAVTAVATAGTLGLFGKAVHYSGDPTQLNCEFDSVAQDLEAVLSKKQAVNNLKI